MKVQQAELFLWFVGFGIVCGVVYDLLRAFRGEVKHSSAVMMAEDVVFCAAACCGCYGIFFEKNHGALRAYGFLGILLGVVLYYLTISRWVLLCFKWCFRILLFPYRWVLLKCKKWKFGRKPLTNQNG